MLEHKCEVCGRLYRKKLKANGMIVCGKHYDQFKKYGKFTDLTPRIDSDKNEITISGNASFIQLYDQFNTPMCQAIIDTEDLDKVKNLRWYLNINGYVMSKDSNIFLYKRILSSSDIIVSFVNGNSLDYRKSNLLLDSQILYDDLLDYTGCTRSNDKWIAKIKINKKTIQLGSFYDEYEAVYARWYAERILFGESAYNKNEPCIPQCRKEDIQKLVNSKVQRL